MMECGELCAVDHGTIMMQRSHVDNWVTLVQVRLKFDSDLCVRTTLQKWCLILIGKNFFCCIVPDAIARSNAFFGRGSGPILLVSVMCAGSEQGLFQCRHDSLDVGSCTHSDDAGVECIEGQ